MRIKACLARLPNSCATGPPALAVTTHESAPIGLGPPSLVSTGPGSVTVKWTSPSEPNGVILRYLVIRRVRSSTDLERGLLVDIVDGSSGSTLFSFVDSGRDLAPYTTYDYSITAVNHAGEVVSNWTTVTTLESAPTGLGRPSINVIGAYGVSISWLPPTAPNGNILSYRIEFYTGTAASSRSVKRQTTACRALPTCSMP